VIPWFVLVAAISFFLVALAPGHISQLVEGPYSGAGARVLWIVAAVAFWLSVRALLVLQMHDAEVTSGSQNRAAEMLFSARLFEEALTFTGAAALWVTFLVIICVGFPEDSSTPVPDLLGRAATLGIVLGLLLIVPRWTLRYWKAYRTVREVAGQGAWLKMHGAAAVVDVMFAIPVTIAVSAAL